MDKLQFENIRGRGCRGHGAGDWCGYDAGDYHQRPDFFLRKTRREPVI